MPKRTRPLPASLFPALIGAFFVACHGLLLLSRGVYWDSWLYYELIRTGDFSTLWWSFSQGGLYSPFLWNSVSAVFPDPILFIKLATFVSLLSATLSFFYLLRRLGPWSLSQCLIATLLLATLPGYPLSVENCLIHYHSGVAWFGLGAVLLLKSRDTTELRKRLALSAGGLLGLWFSYTMNSLLVLHYAFLFFFGLDLLRRERRIRVGSGALLAVLTLMPLLYWWQRPKPHGIFQGYNSVSLGWEVVTRSWGTLRSYLIPSLTRVLTSLEGMRGGILLALLFLPAVYLAVRATRGPVGRPERGSTRKALFAFAVVYGAGIFAYAAVGSLPRLGYDWYARHGFLIIYSVPFLWLTVSSLLLRFQAYRTHSVLAALLISGFASLSIQNYARWDLDWYKQVAMIEHFRASPELKNSRQILIEDQVPNYLGREYRAYEWQALAFEAFGDQKRVVSNDPKFRAATLVMSQTDPAELARRKAYDLMNEFKGPLTAKPTRARLTPGPGRPEGLLDYALLKTLEVFSDRAFKERILPRVRLQSPVLD